MCVYLYIHNKYTQYTLIYYVNKNFLLDAINHLTLQKNMLLLYIKYVYILYNL